MDLGTAGSMRVLGAEVFPKGGATSGTTECPRKEERLQERLNVLESSGLGKALDISQFREDTRSFFLGPPWADSTSS